MNAICFHDPASMGVGQHHTGFHNGVFNHASFEDTVKGLMEFLLAYCNEQPGPTLRIGIYCKIGRRRSVALAVLSDISSSIWEQEAEAIVKFFCKDA